jgi:hypothetical protein
LDNLQGERTESIKAGILAALAFTCAYSLTTLVNFLLLPDLFSAPVGVLMVREAIALTSGFLFGMTYRYLVRYNDNHHLRDGIVLAFALVRGLGLGEVFENFNTTLVILGIEGVFAFAIARFALDFAFIQQWINR